MSKVTIANYQTELDQLQKKVKELKDMLKREKTK